MDKENKYDGKYLEIGVNENESLIISNNGTDDIIQIDLMQFEDEKHENASVSATKYIVGSDLAPVLSTDYGIARLDGGKIIEEALKRLDRMYIDVAKTKRNGHNAMVYSENVMIELEEIKTILKGKPNE